MIRDVFRPPLANSRPFLAPSSEILGGGGLVGPLVRNIGGGGVVLSLYSSHVFKYKLKYKKVGVLPIRIVKSNVLSVGRSSERNSACWMRTIFLSIEIKSNCALNCSRIKSAKELTAFQILTSVSRPWPCPWSVEQNRRRIWHLVQSRNFDKSSPI